MKKWEVSTVFLWPTHTFPCRQRVYFIMDKHCWSTLLHLFLSLCPFFTSASISLGKKVHFLLPFHLCAFEECIKANGFAFGWEANGDVTEYLSRKFQRAVLVTEFSSLTHIQTWVHTHTHTCICMHTTICIFTCIITRTDLKTRSTWLWNGNVLDIFQGIPSRDRK